VTGPVLAERVGWLADLIRGMADDLIHAHWADADLAALATGVGPDGRKLPGNAWRSRRGARPRDAPAAAAR
jgi:hypothetical protein